jgi:hypothetical protein
MICRVGTEDRVSGAFDSLTERELGSVLADLEERDGSPGGRGWPAELETGAPEAIADARAMLADAGVDLGLRRRALARFRAAAVVPRGLGFATPNAAIAGAALVAPLVVAVAVVVWSERAGRG